MTSAPPRDPVIVPGAMLGRYQVLSHLASGGMAEIFLARATGLQGFERHVVVKCIKPEHARDERFVRMFIDEARLSAQLHHQNIAQVYDIGEAEGAYFFAMEYVHGENVRTLLQHAARAQQRVPLAHALTIVAGAAAGLDYAHDKRGSDRRPLAIVHRDVSPSNIIVAHDGAVKVVDFGIAKASARLTETRSGSLKGKIAYMSPEQCRGAPLDRRSDVFSLTVVLYELTTVRRLFTGESDYVTMNKIVTGDFVPPSRVHLDYPPALEAIVLRGLALAPGDRFPTVAAMLDALVQFCAEAQISISSIGLQRYVHEVFGDKPEPWLASGEPPAAAEPPQSGSMHAATATTGPVALAQEVDARFGQRRTPGSSAPAREGDGAPTAVPIGSGFTPRPAPAGATTSDAPGALEPASTDEAAVAAAPPAGPRTALWMSLAVIASGALIAGAVVVIGGAGGQRGGRAAPAARASDAAASDGGSVERPAAVLGGDPAAPAAVRTVDALDAGVAPPRSVDAAVEAAGRSGRRGAGRADGTGRGTVRGDAGVAAPAAPSPPPDASTPLRDSSRLRPPD